MLRAVFHPIKTLTLAVVLGLGLSVSAHASVMGIDNIHDYSVVVTGDYSGTYSDTQYSLAAGGNVYLDGYSVGALSNPGSSARVVAGQDVTFGSSGGSVGPGGIGSILAGGSIQPSGSFTATNKTSNVSSLPVDFSAMQTFFNNTSSGLASQTANGTYSNDYGTLNLSGSDSSLNIFSISQYDWEHSNTVNINTPNDAIIVLNVAGDAVTFGPWGGQISINGVTGGIGVAENALVLYNFFEASSLDLNGSRAPQGSILAPNADVTGGWGQANGQLFAKSFDGNTQFNGPGFAGDWDNLTHTTVPLPATAWLLVSALFGLAGVRHLRSRPAPQA